MAEAAMVRRAGPPVLIAVMLAVGLSLLLSVLSEHGGTVAGPRISLPVLAVLWLAFELCALYLQFGEEVENAVEVVLTEIPLALGLLFATPVDLAIVAVGVPLLLDLLYRRRTALKQLFNAANRFLELGVALWTYRALNPADPFSLQGWLVLLLAVTLAGIAAAVTVSAVISVFSGQRPGRDFAVSILSAVPVALGGTAFAFVAALALQRGTSAAMPLVVALLALLALIRFSSAVTERHANVALLHQLGGRMATARDADAIVSTALETSRALLLAAEAKLYLVTAEDTTVFQEAGQAERGVVGTPVSSSAVPASDEPSRDRRLALATAELAPGRDLVFSVRRSGGNSRPFRDNDTRLLQMVARQTAANLYTAQLVERLRHDALHDSLTGLPNRSLLLEALDERCERRLPAGLAWLGVHDLQAVNAALGYEHGDDLLVGIGQRLRAAVGPGGVVARVGGDEFAVLLPPELEVEAHPETLSGLLASLGRPFPLSGVDVVTRASAGLAARSGDSAVTGPELLRMADIAMRSTRRAGLPFARYTSEMDTPTSERLRLATELQSGIRRGELVLYGQPQVRLTDAAVTGVEVLVRWEHPERGLLFPDTFVPLAEQTGLDGPMTSWVLNAAVKTLAEWHAEGLDLCMSVNVPASALAGGQLLGMVEDTLTLRGVRGEHLVVEVTESGLVRNLAAAEGVLEELSSRGVKVSIDDFGTGFSSLSHLRRLPVDEIKIDRSFVGAMLRNSDDAAIVGSVVGLARGLGLSCVAEGVEDSATYEALRALGCDKAQGYLIARPMPLGEVGAWARNRTVGASDGSAGGGAHTGR